uniref:Uncharacterized protein n=1 Tax=Micrurus lemniscatus lemniscatus TaxID=129467 RepID=A0A2D4IJT1_MICLE
MAPTTDLHVQLPVQPKKTLKEYLMHHEHNQKQVLLEIKRNLIAIVKCLYPIDISQNLRLSCLFPFSSENLHVSIVKCIKNHEQLRSAAKGSFIVDYNQQSCGFLVF